jgi:8-oxo-dGTP pyrophosphatase MutT (NUDIX family)
MASLALILAVASTLLLRRRDLAAGWQRYAVISRPWGRHDKHSPGDLPITEDIQPHGWPELRVYVSAMGWHLVIAICRDLLNPLAVNALAESGANLVLVPAMSETLMAFGGPVAHLVGSGQAFVAVANNPGDWTVDKERTAPSRPARALFGHPGLGQQTRFVKPGDPGPGVALMRVNSAQITWLPSESPMEELGHNGVHAPFDLRPTWVTSLMTASEHEPSTHYGPEPVTLRHAAVLVLLTHGPQGPQVLLTERAQDLTDYPGQIVFPGGAAEPGDSGPIATALREAKEEVGLDIEHVGIIGYLPTLALPDTGFLLHPVLAWSNHPTSWGSVNYAEVETCLEMPLCQLADRHRQTPPAGIERLGPAEPRRLGTVTGAVIDLLLARLPNGQTGCRPEQVNNTHVVFASAPHTPRETPIQARWTARRLPIPKMALSTDHLTLDTRAGSRIVNEAGQRGQAGIIATDIAGGVLRR